MDALILFLKLTHLKFVSKNRGFFVLQMKFFDFLKDLKEKNELRSTKILEHLAKKSSN